MPNIKKYTNKNGDKRYMFRIYLGTDQKTGKKRQTTRRGFKTQREAKLAISKLELQLENGDIKKDTKLRFRDVYAEFMESYKTTVRESSFYTFRKNFEKNILPYFENMYIDKISPSSIQKVVNGWSKTHDSFGTFFRMFKRVLTFAFKRGYINKNPAELVMMPKRKEHEKFDNFYNRKELEEFFNLRYFKLKNRRHVFTYFRLLAFTGLRKSEGLALKWEDIDFENKTITVDKTLTMSNKGKAIVGKPKTQESLRTILVDDKTLQILKRWQIEQRKKLFYNGISVGSNCFVFSNDGTTHLTMALPPAWLKAIYHKNDIKRITIHGFRHTHASMLFAAGVSIKEVQERLGHSDPNMTLKIYTHVTSDLHEKAIRKLSKYADF